MPFTFLVVHSSDDEFFEFCLLKKVFVSSLISKDFIFQSSFSFTAKRRESQRFHVNLLPSHMRGLPRYHHPPPDGTFVSAEQTLTHHCYPKSVVYIRVHSGCCVFCGFGQTCSRVRPSLPYNTEQFHLPKNPLCSTQSSLPLPQTLETTGLLAVSIVLPFPECRIVGIRERPRAFSDWLPHLVIGIQVSSASFYGLSHILQLKDLMKMYP